ncbi:MAG: enoyl-CoA hydratase [Corynebacterium sp.]|uniref:enoyl-CoA hydratase n=1 Tax=Corynebacterium sp. TaxID=1720 RepID=UPI003F999267
MAAGTEGTGLRIERDGKVALLTLCRPERRNALDADLCTAIADTLERLVDEGSGDSADGAAPVRAILIRGEGPAFCAGANLKGGAYAAGFFATVERMITTISDLPVPVIADVQGPAVGAGCQLVLSCDLRVMGPDAQVWVPAVNHGFSLDKWTIHRAVELLGGAVARNVLIAGAKVTQQQAVANGFAIQGGDGNAALELARTISGLAPMPMQHFKMVMNNPEPDEELAATIDYLGGACWISQDASEARAARAEKRAPVFEGK